MDKRTKDAGGRSAGMGSVTKIILDTNFLLIPARLGVDVFSEIEKLMSEKYKLYIVEETVKELKSLSLNPGGYSGFVRIAEQLVEKEDVHVLKTKSFLNTPKLHNNTKKASYLQSNFKDADSVILGIISKNPKEFVVATQDKELRSKVRKLGARTIYLRKKAYLKIE